MIKFIYERPDMHAPYSAVNRVEMFVEDERNLDEYCAAFTEFLNSIGFNLHGGQMEYIKEDDDQPELPL